MNHSRLPLHENPRLHFDLLDQNYQLPHSVQLHCLGAHHPDIIETKITKYDIY
ncbi:hypothetical protein Hanom_Chr11g01005251 [Helianthus anomalus]